MKMSKKARRLTIRFGVEELPVYNEIQRVAKRDIPLQPSKSFTAIRLIKKGLGVD